MVQSNQIKIDEKLQDILLEELGKVDPRLVTNISANEKILLLDGINKTVFETGDAVLLEKIRGFFEFFRKLTHDRVRRVTGVSEDVKWMCEYLDTIYFFHLYYSRQPKAEV